MSLSLFSGRVRDIYNSVVGDRLFRLASQTKHQQRRGSLSSLYHQIKRDGAAYFSISTYYKYVSILKLSRIKAKHRRKNHTIGIRATKPLGILHADVTMIRLLDNTKAYIYLIQDNFSRMILSYRIALKYNAEFMMENLKEVHEKYLITTGSINCKLITDDGSENHSVADEYCKNNSIEHIIAQRDIIQSNSMIEAANRQIKYGFLYHKLMENIEQTPSIVKLAVEDFNNRPYNSLNGLTPIEVCSGQQPAHVSYYKQTKEATRNSPDSYREENKKATCCNFTF